MKADAEKVAMENRGLGAQANQKLRASTPARSIFRPYYRMFVGILGICAILRLLVWPVDVRNPGAPGQVCNV